jgi:import inner membrane translocase subunit TIM16
LTDKLTREHRMTLDEAHLILNTKREEGIEQILKVRPLVYRHHAPTCCDLWTDQNYEHLFRANAPPEVPPTTSAPGGRATATIPRHSHYLQSKVVRARERIEAELEVEPGTPS